MAPAASTLQSAASGSTAAQPPASTAAVFEYICLFTHDLKRKQKRWQDGRLKFHSFNQRIMAYDDRGGFVGDAHWQEDHEFGEGEELRLERGGAIVQVCECVDRREQDLSELLDKRVQEKSQRAAQIAARAPVASAGFGSRPVVRQVPADSFQPRHRPLNQLLGTPTGHHGRAIVPSESPFEQRQKEAEAPPPAKRVRREASPPSKSGYAQNLFGTKLCLSSQPMSSISTWQRQPRPAQPAASAARSVRPSEDHDRTERSTVDHRRLAPEHRDAVGIDKENTSPGQEKSHLPRRDEVASVRDDKEPRERSSAPTARPAPVSLPRAEPEPDRDRPKSSRVSRAEPRAQDAEPRHKSSRKTHPPSEEGSRKSPEIVDLDSPSDTAPEPLVRPVDKRQKTNKPPRPKKSKAGDTTDDAVSFLPAEPQDGSLHQPKQRSAAVSCQEEPADAGSRGADDVDTQPRTELRIKSRKRRGLLMLSNSTEPKQTKRRATAQPPPAPIVIDDNSSSPRDRTRKPPAKEPFYGGSLGTGPLLAPVRDSGADTVAPDRRKKSRSRGADTCEKKDTNAQSAKNTTLRTRSKKKAVGKKSHDDAQSEPVCLDDDVPDLSTTKAVTLKTRKRRHETVIQPEAEEVSCPGDDGCDLPPAMATTSKPRKKARKNNRAPFIEDSDEAHEDTPDPPTKDVEDQALGTAEKDINPQLAFVDDDEDSYRLKNDPILQLALADEESDEDDWVPPPPTPKGNAAKKAQKKRERQQTTLDAEPPSSEPPKGLRLMKLSRKSVKSREIIGYIFDDDAFASPFVPGGATSAQSVAPQSKRPPTPTDVARGLPSATILLEPQKDNTGKQASRNTAEKPMTDTTEVSTTLRSIPWPSTKATTPSANPHASDGTSVRTVGRAVSPAVEIFSSMPSPSPQVTLPRSHDADVASREEARKETGDSHTHTGNQRADNVDRAQKPAQVAQQGTLITTNTRPIGSMPSDSVQRRPLTLEATISPTADVPPPTSRVRQETSSDSAMGSPAPATRREAVEETRAVLTETQVVRRAAANPSGNPNNMHAWPRHSKFRRHYTTLTSADGGRGVEPDVLAAPARGCSLPPSNMVVLGSPAGAPADVKAAKSAGRPKFHESERDIVEDTVDTTATAAAVAATAGSDVEAFCSGAPRAAVQRQTSAGGVGTAPPPPRPFTGPAATTAAAARSAAGATTAALALSNAGGRPRIANPATRGRKAAVKSDAAGKVPQHVLPPDAGLDLAAIRREVLAAVAAGAVPMGMAGRGGGVAGREERVVPQAPKPKITMKFPGFASASTASTASATGPWSREAHDLLGMGRPEGRSG